MLHPQRCRLHIGDQRIERLALSNYLLHRSVCRELCRYSLYFIAAEPNIRIQRGDAAPAELIDICVLLGSVADGELRRRRRGRRAQIGREIADSEISLMTDRGNHGYIARRDRAGNLFFVESPQLLNRAAAAPDYEHIGVMPRIEAFYRVRYLTRRRRALNLNGTDDNLR